MNTLDKSYAESRPPSTRIVVSNTETSRFGVGSNLSRIYSIQTKKKVGLQKQECMYYFTNPISASIELFSEIHNVQRAQRIDDRQAESKRIGRRTRDGQ